MGEDGERPVSYEILEEGYERVFDTLDTHIAEDAGFSGRNYFIDVALVDGVKYQGKQHVYVRERDEDVFEITTPREFDRRIFLYEQSDTERLVDKITGSLQDAIGAVKPQRNTDYFISPDSRTNVLDVPVRGDVMVTLHERARGFPITSFLVHQVSDIDSQCGNGLEGMKRAMT